MKRGGALPAGMRQAMELMKNTRNMTKNAVKGVGELILVSSEANLARYDILHDVGGGETAGFPVYFLKDENGNWKIYCF